MSDKDIVDACLRIVSNRCRNLRKSIDRAKTWQKAAEDGAELNDEQKESIRSVSKKEALLAELQEIHRKQTIVADDFFEKSDESKSPTKPKSKSTADVKVTETSKSDQTENNATDDVGKTLHEHQDVSQASQNSHSNVSQTSNINTSDETRLGGGNAGAVSEKSDTSVPVNFDATRTLALSQDKKDEPAESLRPAETQLPVSELNYLSSVPRAHPLDPGVAVTRDVLLSNASIQPPNPSIMSSDPVSDKVTLLIQEVESRHNIQLEDTKADCVRRILNFFHVADFLLQNGSREALLCYFDTTAGRQRPRRVTSLDVDLIVYFHVMLTTPNGSVPHDEAVSISSAHCLEFLKGSSAEAFKGTSYATLSDIVYAISTCPILTDRGKRLHDNHTGANFAANGHAK